MGEVQDLSLENAVQILLALLQQTYILFCPHVIFHSGPVESK